MFFRRRITLEGLNLERFIRRAAENGIVLDHLERSGPRRLTAVVRESMMTGVQAAVDEGGWRLFPGTGIAFGALE